MVAMTEVMDSPPARDLGRAVRAFRVSAALPKAPKKENEKPTAGRVARHRMHSIGGIVSGIGIVIGIGGIGGNSIMAGSLCVG
jgi:hypothetical protein